MRALETPSAVASATGDLLVRWAAQVLSPEYPHERGAAWQLDDAVVVYAPKLNRENHLFCTGSAASATELIRKVLPRFGSSPPCPLTGAELAHSVAARSELDIVGTFGWMELGDPRPSSAIEQTTANIAWLPDTAEESVAALLRKANPESYLFPDDPGARRWAGAHDATGALVAVAADGWPAPDVGFIGGVVTHPDHRSRGYSRAVCSFVTEQLRREHAAVALMVDEDNAAAIGVYQRLGFHYRPLARMAASETEG